MVEICHPGVLEPAQPNIMCFTIFVTYCRGILEPLNRVNNAVQEHGAVTLTTNVSAETQTQLLLRSDQTELKDAWTVYVVIIIKKITQQW